MFRVLGWEAQRLAFDFLSQNQLRGRHFSGLESARLWLRNSGAAFASWGAVFTWLGAQKAEFFILTRAWPGSQPNAIDPGGGGRITPPRLTPKPMTSARRARRRWKGLGETVLKHSYFFLKRSRVRSRSGQRSKLSVSAFWFSEPPTWLKQAQTRPKHSQRLDEGTVWV